MSSFMYCFPYSYCSSNYCNNNRSCSFMLLGNSENLRKYFCYRLYERKRERQLIPNSWKSDNVRDSNEEKKQRPDAKSNRKKSNFTISILENTKFDSTIIMSQFGGTNNIFVNYNYSWLCTLPYIPRKTDLNCIF